MKKIIVSISAYFLFLSNVYSGGYISASPGIYGTTNISTPWGSYIVSPQGDSVWVGTEAEYMHSRAMGLAQQVGEIEFKTSEGGGQTFFLDGSKPKGVIGDVRVVDIRLDLDFESIKQSQDFKTKKSIETLGLDVLWYQSDRMAITPKFISNNDGQTITPRSCKLVFEMALHVCNFLIGVDKLTLPYSLILSNAKRKPILVPMGTIADHLKWQIESDDKYNVRTGAGSMTRNPNEDLAKQYAKVTQIIQNTSPPAIASSKNQFRKTAEDCMTLIRVAAIADNNARICGTAHGISEAAMNFYSQNNCQRLLKADEINITRQQAAFDATSESNRDGMAAFCTEARAYSDEKAAMFGLTK